MEVMSVISPVQSHDHEGSPEKGWQQMRSEYCEGVKERL